MIWVQGIFVVGGVFLNKMSYLVPFLGHNFLPAGFLLSSPNPKSLLVTCSAQLCSLGEHIMALPVAGSPRLLLELRGSWRQEACNRIPVPSYLELHAVEHFG